MILKGAHGDRYEVSREMAGITFGMTPEIGILIDPPPIWELELKRPDNFGNPALVENIGRESLWL